MHIRSQKTTVGLEAVSIATQTDSTIRMDIYRALQELSPPERTCVTLSVVDDLPIAKIVVITGMPEGTVKSHISRGKEKLANYLKMNGYEDRR